jgi:hypothetical protein
MEKSSKRGKIPQQDWPSIIERYEAGETLASIARTYDCSPPAISYILGRSRARDASVEGTEQSGIESPEPRLVKGHPNDMRTKEFINGAPEIGEAAADGTAGASDVGANIAATDIPGRPAEQDIEAPAQAVPLGTGDSPASPRAGGPQPQPGEPRRTLHLGLSHNNAQPMETPHHEGPVAIADASAVRSVGDQQQGLTQHPARHHSAPNAAANNGGAARSMVESHKGRDGGAFIDRALRERVDGDISAFLAAFDAALADDTLESRAGLREATDRLLRAGARVPLSARNTGGYLAPSWRPR